MYSKKQLANFISFDLETVSEFKDLKTLKKEKPRLGDLWDKRCDYLRNKHEDNKELTNDGIYKEKSGLQAEYGKIVCISIAYLRYDENNVPVIKSKSFASENEKELLTKFFAFLKGAKDKLPDAVYAGHNIKRFDIPFLCKRALINGLAIPDQFNTLNKKPWEMNFADTADIWSFGAWQESFTSLDTLTAILNVPSPKGDIDGSQVSSVFWKDGDVTRIAKYCEQDVIAVINTLVALSGFEIAEPANCISVE